MNYVACFYDEILWVGVVEDVNELNIKVRFMHPHGPVKNFFGKCEMMSAGYSILKLYA